MEITKMRQKALAHAYSFFTSIGGWHSIRGALAIENALMDQTRIPDTLLFDSSKIKVERVAISKKAFYHACQIL